MMRIDPLSVKAERRGGDLVINLREISEDIQEIAEVMSSVLKLDVTIVDTNLVRIGGTGDYKGDLGSLVPMGSSFNVVARTRELIAITDPGRDEVCISCVLRDSCPESASIICPIVVEGDLVGFISLVAWDQQQRERILVAKRDYMDFIRRMSDLLSSKISAMQMIRQLSTTSAYLHTILDSVHEGIVVVGVNGEIVSCNSSAEKMLGVDHQHLEGKGFAEFFPLPISHLLETGERFTDREIYREKDNKSCHFLCTGAPIIKDGKVTGSVVTLKDFREVQRLLAEVSEGVPGCGFEAIISRSRAMTEVKEKAIKAARTNSTVLIRGESGTGKELLARAIHTTSARRAGPFVAVNCGAIPQSLLESELFGYEEGAFTGARRGGKPGKFELANGGTIFLDEVGDMSLHLQVKLLRVLQDGVFEKVGGQKPRKADVRVVAATHRLLEDMVERGLFRQDLYFRLNVIPIILPPLRVRDGDVLLLLDYFLAKYNVQLGKNVKGFAPDAMAMLLRYSWPGNIRELQNVVEYAMNMVSGERITTEYLPQLTGIGGREQVEQQKLAPIEVMVENAFRDAVARFGRSESGVREIARTLGISRATVYRKLKEYALNR
jgi:PAS domain S-box-containing protein